MKSTKKRICFQYLNNYSPILHFNTKILLSFTVYHAAVHVQIPPLFNLSWGRERNHVNLGKGTIMCKLYSSVH